MAINRSGLTVEGLRLAYGDVTAVWDASLSARPGTITALLGRNGAGKSTTLLGIAGLVKAAAGSVRLGAADVTRLPAWRRSRAGIALVPEGKRVFRDLTVTENLVVAAPRESARGRAGRLEQAFTTFPRLAEFSQKLAGSLSGGQQQMLAIAAALMSEPPVLLVDEPSSGLSPIAFDEVLEVIVELKKTGISVVLVEQLVHEVMNGVADEVVVMDRGRIELHGSAADISIDQISRIIAHDSAVETPTAPERST